MNIFYKIIGLFALLLLSAFFSGTETALTSLGRIKLKTILERGDDSARKLRGWAEDPGRFLAAILVGNNAVNIGASVLATFIAVEIFSGRLTAAIAWGVTAALTVTVLIFCEIMPKMFARDNAETTALRTIGLLMAAAAVLSPLIKAFTALSRKISRALGAAGGAGGPFLTADDVKSVIGMGEEEGVIDEGEREMLEGIIELKETSVREVMVPRTEMVCVSARAGFRDVIKTVVEAGHSRIPVFEGSIDNITGILYAKDLLRFSGRDPDEVGIKEILHQPYFVPESKNISALLEEFQAKKIHMAVIVDEYGGTAGLVTLEDLIEEIVGDIEDEHDFAEKGKFEIVNDDEVIVSARANVGEINEELGITLPEPEDVETLAGLITGLLGKVPSAGEEVSSHGLRFRVIEATKRRIGKVRISGLRAYREKRKES